MNHQLRNALLGGAALVGAGLIGSLGIVDVAEAQTAALPGGVIAVQQSAARADAASFMQSATTTVCTTTQNAVAGNTLTITPPAGNYVYLTNFYVEVGSNGTGASSVANFASTNLTGSPAWAIATLPVTAGSESGEAISEIWPTGYKSTVAGTAVSLTPSATLASSYVCAHASGYYSPI